MNGFLFDVGTPVPKHRVVIDSGIEPPRSIESFLATFPRPQTALFVAPTSEPTDGDRGLLQSLHSTEGAGRRWEVRQRAGLNDEELRKAISYEFGIAGGGPYHNAHAGGEDPRFWPNELADRKRCIKGKPLLDCVRRLMRIPFADPGRPCNDNLCRAIARITLDQGPQPWEMDREAFRIHVATSGQFPRFERYAKNPTPISGSDDASNMSQLRNEMIRLAALTNTPLPESILAEVIAANFLIEAPTDRTLRQETEGSSDR